MEETNKVPARSPASSDFGVDPEKGDVKPKSTGIFARAIDSLRPVDLPNINHDLSRTEKAVHATVDLPLKQALKPRHLQMIAIGGTIGAGLFISSGNMLRNGGPAATLIGYGLMGCLLFVTTTSLGELAVRFPVTGAFSAYASRFVDHSWGFSIGWLYVFEWIMSMPAELTAASVIIGFWNDDNNGATNVNKAAWVALFWAVITFVNIFGVRGYGEVEVFLSMIKVLAIVGFIIFGIIATCGGVPNTSYIGARYYHDPGAFSNGFKGVCKVFVSAAYAFTGTELVGLAAAETTTPHISIPRAVKQVFWRIILFYLVSMVLVGCLVPYNNPRLGAASDGSASPFVIAIRSVGVKALPSIFNTVILLAVIGVGNSAVWASSRTLVSLAAQGHAPKFLLWIDRNGRPVAAVAICLLFGLIGFVSATDNYGTAFTWISNIQGCAGLIMWLSINVCHIRYRLAMRVQGYSVNDLEYKAPLGIYGSCIGVAFVITVLGVQFWTALFPTKEADAYNFFENYLGFIVIFVFFVLHKAWYRDPFTPLSEIDLLTGGRISDLEEMRRLVAEQEALQNSRRPLVRLWFKWC